MKKNTGTKKQKVTRKQFTAAMGIVRRFIDQKWTEGTDLCDAAVAAARLNKDVENIHVLMRLDSTLDRVYVTDATLDEVENALCNLEDAAFDAKAIFKV